MKATVFETSSKTGENISDLFMQIARQRVYRAFVNFRFLWHVDPDPVGSAFILVRGSGSKGIKWREEFSQQIVVFFCWKFNFSSMNLKKVLVQI